MTNPLGNFGPSVDGFRGALNFTSSTLQNSASAGSFQVNQGINQLIQQSSKPRVISTVYIAPPLDESAHPVLNAHQLATIATLQRNHGQLNDILSLSPQAIQERIDDPNTSEEMKAAWRQVKDDPTLIRILDTAASGVSGAYCDGRMGANDLDAISAWTEVQQFNTDRATQLTQTYIPSDSNSDPLPNPRPMTENDAKRELYRYSDYLPETITVQTLSDIVSGTSHIGKCPAQVIAAAQYYLDHPEKWSAIAKSDGLDNGVADRASLLDNISNTLYLSPSEADAITVLHENWNVHGGDFSRGKLEEISNNTSYTPELRAAARKLFNDDVLFGMLDNAGKGHHPGDDNEVDDSYVSDKDFNKFLENWHTKGLTDPELTKPCPPTATDAQGKPLKQAKAAGITLVQNPQWAIDLMDSGVKEPPEVKTTKGGNPILAKFRQLWKNIVNVCKKALNYIVMALEKIAAIPVLGAILGPLIIDPLKGAIAAIDSVLTVITAVVNGRNIKDAIVEGLHEAMAAAASIMHSMATVLGFLVKIPVIGEIALAASLLAEVVGGGLDLAGAAINGEDMAKAAMMFSLGLGASAVSSFTVPGAGSAVLKAGESSMIDIAVADVKGTSKEWLDKAATASPGILAEANAAADAALVLLSTERQAARVVPTLEHSGGVRSHHGDERAVRKAHDKDDVDDSSDVDEVLDRDKKAGDPDKTHEQKEKDKKDKKKKKKKDRDRDLQLGGRKPGQGAAGTGFDSLNYAVVDSERITRAIARLQARISKAAAKDKV